MLFWVVILSCDLFFLLDVCRIFSLSPGLWCSRMICFGEGIFYRFFGPFGLKMYFHQSWKMLLNFFFLSAFSLSRSPVIPMSVLLNWSSSSLVFSVFLCCFVCYHFGKMSLISRKLKTSSRLCYFLFLRPCFVLWMFTFIASYSDFVGAMPYFSVYKWLS